MSKFNPFQSLTKEEKEAKEKAANEAAQRIIEARAAARECLKTKEFTAYVERYKKAEAVLVKMLLELDAPDPMQEWKLFKEIQTKLKMLRAIMADVTKDAK